MTTTPKPRVMYKGREYEVEWAGKTKTGKLMHRLSFINGDKEFWADSALVSPVTTKTKSVSTRTPMRRQCFSCNRWFNSYAETINPTCNRMECN